MRLHDNVASMTAMKVSAGPGETSADASADVREWRELLARHADLTCALDRALQAGHSLGMSEYEVLERLAELPEQSAKVQTIAESILESGQNTPILVRQDGERFVLVEEWKCSASTGT